ncbi:L-histidine N(alpha)-methyltransferase [Pontibacter cellulosilyticus]|uniref:L-histidine N(Alpha)-methyltransferase n=1 Tax=Pontibacter cellulosilyticus TaxID=1720253 RepID=A0A923N429_9BACT|nr:L-histidine N(alpha)-methyltransferase [Pontibacter cellulosilyticus]MBC5991499.1 L-histidine N(alpha)-methyltransferase [Pontibacter cellulosilyticus]
MELNSTLAPIIDLSRKQDGTSDTAAFAKDVAHGLSLNRKDLPSRYFYDGRGSQLFQEIMNLPEYYLTRAEHEVFTSNKAAICSKFAEEGFFHLIDLGAGDALKTKILLQQLSQQKADFDYVPVDISGDAMQQLSDSLRTELPDMTVQAVVGEYFKALEWLQENKSERKVVLFLGSNIGNFEKKDSIEFLQSVRSYLSPGDKLLMGVDLRKNPDVILKAYDDAAGITAEFNLNLLRRINRELGGEFILEQFRHYAIYNPLEGVMRSFLISLQEQDVYIRDTGKTYHFDAWEAIHTENSHKYSVDEIEELGNHCGFTIEKVYYDTEKHFADVLFSAS